MPAEDDASETFEMRARRVVPDEATGDRRMPFTLSGEITQWTQATRELGILDRVVHLAPHVSPLGLAVGLQIAVAGYHDPRTSGMVVTRLVLL